MLSAFQTLEQELLARIVGQSELVERLMIALLANGHLLVEGAPGLAKTRAVRLLASMIQADFQRIQFTPDLLPADITGTEIFRPEDGSFEFQPGPVFNHMVLADEINRAPAKVQSALLEAMSEQQVSIGRKTFALPPLFLVMATQNPIEQEGTYRLPEAQLDRFLLKVIVGYPDADSENSILELARQEAITTEANDTDSIAAPLVCETAKSQSRAPAVLAQQDIFAARQQVLSMHMNDSVQQYLLQLVLASRHPQHWSEELAAMLDYGASPRATIALDRAAKARAWLQGRDFVTPEDVTSMLHDCLRHRLVMSLEAEAAGKTADDAIDLIVELVPSA